MKEKKEKTQRKPNGQFVKGNKEGNRFSETNRANPENISKGRQAQIARDKEEKRMQDVAMAKLNTDIAGITFQEVSIDKLQEYVQSPDAKPEVIIRILEFLRDTSGQKPTEKQEVSGDMKVTPTTFNILPVKGKDEL